ncbi:MFS transporter [Sporolactobacillus sp. CPB3-1]|uniref:MFS transporter n=1 Tax=Sporolactobacillus mangiferae TaxID=2940498 RepID=A0ABT0MBJ7_9BACL|nr:MFS transporter [Sporolactobacillus mangiferae]MCL1632048.1 MFS transporter [Sporolactobacillus mangiferae]
MNRSYQRFQFLLLISSVFICGAAEGMLLPLIASLLEKNGVSAIMNGLGSTSLYIGMLVSVPLMEKPMQKFGYKCFLIAGLALITLPLFLFPIWMNLYFWFVLRLCVGFGDSMLHFAAQTWITVDSPVNRRGRNIAIYGLSFGIGFAAGPMLVRLLFFGTAVPFITSGLFCTVVLLLLFLLKNEYPELSTAAEPSARQFFSRYKKVIAAAWSGFAVTFAFGYLETSLNNSFPVFALRQGYSLDSISILLPAFVTGGLLTQVPLGMLGDRFGRRYLLPVICLFGALLMTGAGLLSEHFYGIYLCLLGAGTLVGSLYSMSMGYVSDLLDSKQIPLGNILMTVCYSIGCMIGPVSGSVLIGWIPGGGLFYGIAVFILLASLGCFIHQFYIARRAALDHSHISGKMPNL